MITNNNIIKGKKPSGLMLSPQLKTIGILEAFPYVRNAPCITQDLALLSVRLATREKGNYGNQCPKANNNAHGRAYLLRDNNAHQDPNVVTDLITEKVEACLKLLEVDSLEVLLSKVKGIDASLDCLMVAGSPLTLKKMEKKVYVVTHCSGFHHEQWLRKGGEFLTHVRLLMAHWASLSSFRCLNVMLELKLVSCNAHNCNMASFVLSINEYFL
ncbi:putative reverse transcriptase domain-containing protein [Tanacetum coccineum]